MHESPKTLTDGAKLPKWPHLKWSQKLSKSLHNIPLLAVVCTTGRVRVYRSALGGKQRGPWGRFHFRDHCTRPFSGCGVYHGPWRGPWCVPFEEKQWRPNGGCPSRDLPWTVVDTTSCGRFCGGTLPPTWNPLGSPKSALKDSPHDTPQPVVCTTSRDVLLGKCAPRAKNLWKLVFKPRQGRTRAKQVCLRAPLLYKKNYIRVFS